MTELTDEEQVMAEEALEKVFSAWPTTIEDLLPSEQRYLDDYMKRSPYADKSGGGLYSIQNRRAETLTVLRRRRDDR